MDNTINLCEILKNCPEGTELWSDNYGVVQFKCIVKNYIGPINYPILVNRSDGHNVYYTKEGCSDILFPASCLLWPSKDCRDWSKFTAPWHKKEKQGDLSQTNERAWLYLVSDVLTWNDGIGQYLDDPRVQELAKRLCSKYAQKL